ncbi:MAG: hypothetical protein KJ749_11595 [Planctomycetes bacterium]|nr:hypothetical protein [Planctomycetota bacterium]
MQTSLTGTEPRASARAESRSLKRVRHAFTLAETLVSILLVGGLLAVVLDTTGAAIFGQQRTADRGIGVLLAQDLMTEILSQVYEEPDETGVFGREASESSATRADFDDVDDYSGWKGTPPKEKDGTEIPDRTGWRRSVVVEYVDPEDIEKIVAGETGIKQITVTVEYKGLPMASLVAVRTLAADRCAPGS